MVARLRGVKFIRDGKYLVPADEGMSNACGLAVRDVMEWLGISAPGTYFGALKKERERIFARASRSRSAATHPRGARPEHRA